MSWHIPDEPPREAPKESREGEPRVLTPAEYAAWAESRMRQLADEFTQMLPQEARDAGIRVERGSMEQSS